MNRLSSGTVLAGVAAVLFGLLAAYVVRKQLLKPVPAPAKEVKAPELLIVPVAAGDLPAGRRVTLGDVGILRLTQDQVKKQGFNKPFMNRTPQIVGRTLRVPLKRGKSFEPGDFYSEGQGPNVSELLEPGYRAVTFTVEIDAAVAGFTTAGSFVDILFRANADGTNDLPETTVPLMEAVKVLALNSETSEGTKTAAASGRHQLTVAVRPEQAAALQIVAGHGVLTLALRNPGDADQFVATSSPRTLDELLERRSRRIKLDVYRGRGVSRLEFRNQGLSDGSLPQGVTEGNRDTQPVPPSTPINTPVPRDAANPDLDKAKR
jgi:Flp pilus assembly protein CpaB